MKKIISFLRGVGIYLVYGVIAFGIALFLLWIGSFFVSPQLMVEKRVEVKAAPDFVYNYFLDPKNWPDWLEYSRGGGASYAYYTLNMETNPENIVMIWKNVSRVGYGYLTFDKVDKEARVIEYTQYFSFSKTRIKGRITVQEGDDSAFISWTVVENVGTDPVSRYILHLQGEEIQNSYEKTMQTMKKLIES